MTSSYVQRNLDSAQYAQPRGSQYEGPRSSFEEENDSVNEDAREVHNPFLCDNCSTGKSHNKYAVLIIGELELRALHGDR